MTAQGVSWRIFLCVSVFLGGMLGCGGGVSSPQFPDGSKITLFLYSDAGIRENMPEAQKADRKTLSEWMATDTERRLKEGGFLIAKLDAQNNFKPAPHELMVVVTLDSFRAEDMLNQKELRLGEGVTHIQAAVELFKDNHTLPALRFTDGTSTSREWTVGAGELTASLAAAVSDRVAELYR